VRNGYERPGALLLMLVGILATWLPVPLRVAWALSGVVVLLIRDTARAMQKRPSYLLTEDSGYLLTESGDRLISGVRSRQVRVGPIWL
jgi:hypothetical protein